MMVKGMAYVEKGIKKYEEQLLAQKQKPLVRLAKDLNVQMV